MIPEFAIYNIFIGKQTESLFWGWGILAKMEISKTVIAKERDKLREQYSDMESLLDSLDSGIENIEYGKTHIEIGIDEFSQYL